MEKALSEYGALGVLVGSLIWLLRYVLTILPEIIQSNTRAITELTATMRGQSFCPYQERRQIDGTD